MRRRRCLSKRYSIRPVPATRLRAGFLGYLASCDAVDDASMARAIIFGSTLASFAVEDFSVDRLLRLTRDEVNARFSEFKKLTHFDVV